MVHLSPTFLFALRTLCSLNHVSFYANAVEKNESIMSPSFPVDVSLPMTSSSLSTMANKDNGNIGGLSHTFETMHDPIEDSSIESSSTNLRRTMIVTKSGLKNRHDASSPSSVMNEPLQVEMGSSATLSRAMLSIGDTLFRPIGQEIEGALYDYLFGSSVSLSKDGEYVAIAGSKVPNFEDGPSSGLVQVYKYSPVNHRNGIWTQYGDDIETETGGLKPYTEVSISNNGSVLAVASVYVNLVNRDDPLGAVTFYEISNGTWVQKGSAIEGGKTGEVMSGLKVALSNDGKHVIIGSPFYSDKSQDIGYDTGRVRVYNFKNANNDWIQMGSDFIGSVDGDKLGSSVALMVAEGYLYIAFGATGEDTINGVDSGNVEVYRWSEINLVWTLYGNKIIGEAAKDESGFSVALAYTIEMTLRIAIGAVLNDGDGGTKISAGHVRIYDYSLVSEKWEQVGSDLDGESGVNLGSGYYRTGDFFGFSVDLSEDGSRLVAGAPLNNGGTTYYGGHTRVFDFNSGTEQWLQVSDDIDGTDSSDTTGHSVSMSADGKSFAVGGPGSAVDQSAGGVVIWQEDEASSSPSMAPSNQPSNLYRYYRSFMVLEMRSDFEIMCYRKHEIQGAVVSVLEEIIGSLNIDASINFDSNCENGNGRRRLQENNDDVLDDDDFFWYFRFAAEFIQYSRDDNPSFLDNNGIMNLMDTKKREITRQVKDETGVLLRVLIFIPIENPSSSPSVTFQPSDSPSRTNRPSLSSSPSLVPSMTPSPTVSSKPTGFYHNVFKIYTDSDKFDFTDESFCLTAKYAAEGYLYVRPCNARFAKRQTWMRTIEGYLKLRDYDFCIDLEGRKLFLKQCSPDSTSFKQLSRSSTSIGVEKANGTFYIGFNPLKIFSKLQLYKGTEDNLSIFQWRLGFLDDNE